MYTLSQYLHSTMYLFKQFGKRQTNDLKCNLHSTMYLFKPSGCLELSDNETQYLHSTMYLFQPASSD